MKQHQYKANKAKITRAIVNVGMWLMSLGMSLMFILVVIV